MLVRRRQKSGKALTITVSAILVLLSRGLFFFHSSFTAWRVVDKIGSYLYLIVGVVVVFSLIEICWVLFRRKAKEWTWFSVHVFLYLVTVVPGIWLLRLEHVNKITNPNRQDCMLQNGTLYNGTLYSGTLQNGTHNAKCDENLVEAVEALSTQFGVHIPLKLNASTWLQLLPQSLIFILIITRWIAPFGRASHRKLSEQLFVYVGLGSDIVELFSLYDEDYAKDNDLLLYWILGTWTLSLTQFVLPLTGAIAPSNRRDIDKTPGACRDCMRYEAWTIVAIVMLQDGPFLMIRLYIMIGLGQFTYSVGFFVVKNILVICLQLYRFLVLAFCVDAETGQSIRRRRRPLTDYSSSSTQQTGTQRTNSSSNSSGGDVVPELKITGVMVLEESEEEQEQEDEDNEVSDEADDIEDQRTTPVKKEGHSNEAYSRDSLDTTA